VDLPGVRMKHDKEAMDIAEQRKSDADYYNKEERI